MQRVNPATKLATAGIGLVLALLVGCSDWYSEPVVLADQEGLSDVYEDRPLYSSFYYEGRHLHEGAQVHVFVMRVVSKFTPQDAYYVYYLPVSEMEINATVGSYGGEGNVRRRHRLVYEHDRGQFRLWEGRHTLELIPANFSEAHSYRESRCRKAMEKASGNPDAYPQVKYAADTCFWSGNYEESRKFTILLRDNINHFDSYTSRGQMRHDYHTLMGRHLLREGEVEQANSHLLQSIDVRPSAVMSSFGPNMELAMDLLKAGETDTVLEYLDGCAGFWNEEQIRTWKREINEGGIPVLNQYQGDGEIEAASTKPSPCACAFSKSCTEEQFLVCRSAAESGDARNQNLLGILYENGKGTEQDYRQAMLWYQRAADQGEKYGQFNLGHLYRTGKSGAKDPSKAVQYYRLAAEQDYGEAQFSLGIMYFRGSGTPKDLEQARVWWERALDNGVARAEGALKQIP
jgi:hypothetical protein